jgi:hypothetical protein
MSGRRRIELSATQLTASVLAAVTAAVAASYLGVAGTIIGAGVVSFATTAGTAIYRHYLARTEEKLRAAASQLPHGNIRAGSHRLAESGSPPQARAPEKASVPGRHASGSPDPALATGAAPRSGNLPGTWAEALTGGPSGAGGHPAPAEPTGPVEPPGPATAGEGSGQHAAGKPGRPRWLAWAGLAVAVFLLTMAAITVFEVATGRPLNATVWNQHGSGTTIGDVVTGRTGSGATHPTGHPTGRATAPATTGSTPSPSPTGSTSPTATPTTPTPSPTGTGPSPDGSTDPPSPAASS